MRSRLFALSSWAKTSGNPPPRWIPEVPDYGKKITIRNLLHHTGGLRDYIELMDLQGVQTEDLTTDQDALQIISRQKAVFEADRRETEDRLRRVREYGGDGRIEPYIGSPITIDIDKEPQ